MKKNILVCLTFAGSLFAQTITSVQNPASNIPQVLPNGAVAPGSIIVIYGSKLGPATISLAQSLPFTTSLSGTSVSVTVSGTTAAAFMDYTLATQVAVILPSSTPVGTGTITVTYSGAASPAFPIVVAKSAFGISTINQTGAGAGVVTFGQPVNNAYVVLSPANPAKPGDTVVIWGTGLGAAKDDSGTGAAGIDLGTSIQVWAGGVSASVTYRGRSAGPGLDQINFVVPPGVSGCNVSLVVQTGNQVSNTTTMPISASGACSDPNGLTAALNSALAGKANVVQASIGVSTVSLAIAGTALPPTVINSGSASFQRYTQLQYLQNATPPFLPSYGSCVVTILYNNAAPAGVTPIGLDAGTAISLTTPSNNTVSLTTTAAAKGIYGSTAIGTVADGTYKVNNGSGGADIGPFSISANGTTPMTWTNSSAFSGPVDRTMPQTLTWSGGDPAGEVFILGQSGFGANGANAVQFVCTSPTSAGKLTIPTQVLLALPPTPDGPSIGILLVGGGSGQIVSIPGTDIALFTSSSLTGTSTTFK